MLRRGSRANSRWVGEEDAAGLEGEVGGGERGKEKKRDMEPTLHCATIFLICTLP
jgi:hypothetical protein